VSEWQPIETAPLSRAVLVYIPSRYPSVYRAIQLESFTNVPRWHSVAWSCGSDVDARLMTHWMPLPDPPEA
jgi:hypothetical protein